MNKAGIENSLRLSSNGRPFISTGKLRKWLGLGERRFKEWTKDLDRRVVGNRIEFFIGDVADKILEECHEV